MTKEQRKHLEASVRYWLGKVLCPYKAPELRCELALEAFGEFEEILNPPKEGDDEK